MTTLRFQFLSQQTRGQVEQLGLRNPFVQRMIATASRTGDDWASPELLCRCLLSLASANDVLIEAVTNSIPIEQVRIDETGRIFFVPKS